MTETIVVQIAIPGQPNLATLPPSASIEVVSLQRMTAIFGLAVDRVISTAVRVTFPETVVDYAGTNVTLRTAYLVAVNLEDATRLQGAQYVIVLPCVTDGPSSHEARLQTQSDRMHARLSILRQTILQPLAPDPSVRAGNSEWIAGPELDSRLDDVAIISAFYFLGWLSLIALEREQIQQNLTGELNLAKQLPAALDDQRVSLLNIRRYYLTRDRTNDTALRAVCDRLVEKYALSDRHQRQERVLRDLEVHSGSVLDRIEARRSRIVATMITILTIVSVPLTLVGVLLAIDLDSSIYRSWLKVLSDPVSYALVGTGLLAILVPAAILRIGELLRGDDDRRPGRKLERRKTSNRQRDSQAN